VLLPMQLPWLCRNFCCHSCCRSAYKNAHVCRLHTLVLAGVPVE
jgi:hypothetical protein